MTCPHGEAHPSACMECLDGQVAPPSVWRRVGDPFAARYQGECPTCGRLFTYSEATRNERIQRWDLGDERTVYVHVGCGAPPR